MNNLNWPFIISKSILDFFINSESIINSLDSRYSSNNRYICIASIYSDNMSTIDKIIHNI